MEDANVLEGFKPARRWREQQASAVFATVSAWEWFSRAHRPELIASGQLIPGRGRRGDLVGPGIGAVVLAILRRQAAESRGYETTSSADRLPEPAGLATGGHR